MLLELSHMDAESGAIQAMALLGTLGIDCRVIAASATRETSRAIGRGSPDYGMIGRFAATKMPRNSPIKGGLAPWQVRRVTGFIDANLTRQVAIFELSALVSLSPFHFARAFRASVGMPPGRFQTERRIARARLLLVETDCSITDIALDLGFADASYLSRMLKRELGLTATEIRRSR